MSCTPLPHVRTCMHAHVIISRTYMRKTLEVFRRSLQGTMNKSTAQTSVIKHRADKRHQAPRRQAIRVFTCPCVSCMCQLTFAHTCEALSAATYAYAYACVPQVKLIDMCEKIENMTRFYLEADKSLTAGVNVRCFLPYFAICYMPYAMCHVHTHIGLPSRYALYMHSRIYL